MKVVLTDQAQRDIQSTRDWWAKNRSPSQAAQWFRGIARAIRTLGKNPKRFPLSPEHGEVPYEIRELYFGIGRRPTHRAVFTVREEVVLVLAVRHLAQEELTSDDLA